MTYPTPPTAIRYLPRLFIAFAVSALLLIGQATNATTGVIVGLVNTVIGIGGRGDAVSANVPAKLHNGVVPPGYFYDAIHYPASIELSKSTDVSTPLVYQGITSRPGEDLIVAGYSEGALAGEAVKRLLVKNNTGPAATDLHFLQIASPFAGNGGIFARFAGLSIPFIVNNMGPAQVSPYDTTYVTNEYDPYADFPAYFNPLALVNTLLGVLYAHPDAYYDAIQLGTTPSITTTVPHVGAGTDTYVFVPNSLPLLAPIRAIAGALHLTPLVNPILDAVEPLLRVAIDMAYTDRANLHPETFRGFSLITPLPRIIAALQAIPGAIKQGIDNFVTDVRAILQPAASTPPVVAPTSAAPGAATPDAKAITAQPRSQDRRPTEKPGTQRHRPRSLRSDRPAAPSASAAAGTSASRAPGPARPDRAHQGGRAHAHPHRSSAGKAA